ncbi:MAG: hypothetical protein HGGPFJEG_03153 [Ignavibacteria bacterium]|nr:hypothetical protein [Ignavibacteria bacterium]
MNKFLFFLSFILCVNIAYAVNPVCELYIINFVTDTNLYVRFYPVGSIYHKEINVSSSIERYSIRSQKFIPGSGTVNGISRRGEIPGNNKLKYIVGLDGFALNNRSPYPGYFEIKPDLTGISYDKWLLLGNDASANSDLDGLFGFGKYILEIYKTTNSGTSFQQIVQIPIDWLDFNYPYMPGTGGSQDLFLRIYSISPLYITFQWSSTVQGDELPLFGSGSPPYDGGIQIYKQYHRFDTTLAEWMGYNLHNEHPPSKGNSVSDSNFTSYPLDGRALPEPYAIPVHLQPGDLSGNLTAVNDITTLDSLYDSVTVVTITENTIFKLNDGKIFHMITPSYPSGGYTNLIIGEDSAKLQLRPNSQIIADPPNRITLKNGGFLLKNPGSRITINPGAYLCNEGGSIRGSGCLLRRSGCC